MLFKGKTLLFRQTKALCELNICNKQELAENKKENKQDKIYTCTIFTGIDNHITVKISNEFFWIYYPPMSLSIAFYDYWDTKNSRKRQLFFKNQQHHQICTGAYKNFENKEITKNVNFITHESCSQIFRCMLQLAQGNSTHALEFRLHA